MTNLSGTLNQSITGLRAAQYALSVVSQNIANANTPGYTKESANLEEVSGPSTGLYTGHGSLGGVRVASTGRNDDPVLDARLRTTQADSSMADTTASQLASVETLFPEPSSSGLGAQLNAVWNDWGNVSNNPGGSSSTAVRQTLLSDTATAAGTLNTMSSNLTQVASTTSQELAANVTTMNTDATDLAKLNGQIGIATATGANANSLLDQRDSLLSNLSSLAGAVATINANGSATVLVNGQTLVSSTTSNAVSVNSTNQISVGGTAVTLSTGSMAAQVSALNTTIPGFQSQLDSMAAALASTLNNAQANGFDQNGNAGTAMIGPSSGSGPVTAANISVILTNPAGIAAAATQTTGGNLDGSNALAVSNTGTSATSPDSMYATLVGAVGTASASAQQRKTNQDAVNSAVLQQQQSISGVNYDQEVSDMMTYQQAYNASAKVLTTIDSLLDTLINLVGNS
jgi:flagellar hook-associated protein 1 FlgK